MLCILGSPDSLTVTKAWYGRPVSQEQLTSLCVWIRLFGGKSVLDFGKV